MSYIRDDIDQLEHEHRALMCVYGSAQQRCSEQAQIQKVQMQLIDHLQSQVMCLRARLIASESLRLWEVEDRLALDELLQASLNAADRVICQTGCVSHNAYWREDDQCRRTGKACVLIEPPARGVGTARELADSTTTANSGSKV